MKSTQLLSVVFSLIMFTGVTAGNTAFAESDDLDDILEDFCELNIDPDTFFGDNLDLEEFRDEIILICELPTEDEREDAIDLFIIDNFPEAIEEDDEVVDSYEDCVEADGTVVDNECTFDDMVFVNDEDDNDDEFDLDDLLDRYCELNDEDKRQLLADHPRLAPFNDRLANYCEMSDDEQDAIDELIEEHGDSIRMQLREYKDDMHDKMSDHMDYKKDMREHLDRYCEMSDEDKLAFVAENDKAEDHVEKMNRYCTLDEIDRMNFIEEHKDEYMKHMKAQMHDKKSDHMDYDRLCAMTETDRALEIDDSERLDRISVWCEMSTEEREDYKKESHDSNKSHDFDNMSDVAKDHMSDTAKDKHEELRGKFSEQSDRLKAMIMDKRDISDERADEIKMKFEAKFGEDSDKKRSEIKMKYKDHVKHMKFKMSDERKSDVHERLAEMKAYKAELRENSSELSEQEKQQLREEFIEKAKDMQLAWISPRTQMTAGIDAAEVECREGYSLVMKASNGVAMCLKADTALKMIDRGIVVPAN